MKKGLRFEAQSLFFTSMSLRGLTPCAQHRIARSNLLLMLCLYPNGFTFCKERLPPLATTC